MIFVFSEKNSIGGFNEFQLHKKKIQQFIVDCCFLCVYYSNELREIIVLADLDH